MFFFTYFLSKIFIHHRLTAYRKVGRNFLWRKMTPEIRYNNLKRGKAVVVALLSSELPATKHDPQSFAVDLTFFTVRPL
jgi:hypothetical protein